MKVRVKHQSDPNARVSTHETDELGGTMVDPLEVPQLAAHGFVVFHLKDEPSVIAKNGSRSR